MEIDLHTLLQSSPTLVIFVAIALGYLVGKVNIRGFELGAIGGVLMVALVFGHYGFEPHPIVGTIGFTLFIYSVGLQAGPRFFDVLMEDGMRYIWLALAVAGSAFVTAKLMALAFTFDNGLAAGVLAGAVIRSRKAEVPARHVAKLKPRPTTGVSACGSNVVIASSRLAWTTPLRQATSWRSWQCRKNMLSYRATRT